MVQKTDGSIHSEYSLRKTKTKGLRKDLSLGVRKQKTHEEYLFEKIFL